MYRIGRLLQVIGLLIAPIGMAGNLLDPNTITESHILLTLFGGLLLFGFGRAVQGPTRT
ncbi:MAG: hypothetical protein K1X57_17870 [Gemmataceae bacterium]|nr:hypothetical protein [Gemmataceae bacterium]